MLSKDEHKRHLFVVGQAHAVDAVAGLAGESIPVTSEVHLKAAFADHLGAKVAEADRETQSVLTATFDLDATAQARRGWGVFRDRRPEHYSPIMTLDGGR